MKLLCILTLSIVALPIVAISGCSNSGSADGLREAEQLMSEGNYDGAKSAAFNSSDPAKYDFLKKIDERKSNAETQLAEIKFTVAHAYDEGRDKVQKKLEQIQKETLDRKVKSEATAAIAGLDKLFANQPKPQPIPENIQRPGVIESEPKKVIRTLDTKPPEDSLKKKTVMAPTPRVKEVLESAQGDVNHWRYRQALELLAMAAAEMSPEERDYLKSVHAEITAAASQALAALVLEANSEIGNRQQTLEKLYERLANFPPSEDLKHLRDTIEPVIQGTMDATKVALDAPGTRKPVRTVPKSAPGGGRGKSWLPSEEGVDEFFLQAQTAADAWDFAGASALYKKAWERATIDILKKEAEGRFDDMDRLAKVITYIHEGIVENPDSFREFDPGTGRKARLTGAGARGLVMESPAGQETIGWNAISGAAWRALFAKVTEMHPEQKISAAVLLARANLMKESDQFLKEAVDGDPKLQPVIDGILARRRGIETPSYGFVWFNHQWMTFRERESQKLAGRIRELLARIEAASSPRERDGFSQELGKLGTDAAEALEIAFKEKKIEITKRLTSQGLARKVSALREERIALDKARQYALDLIFDEEKYFYPYRPPECPPEKAKLYGPVQQEVSKRVAAVSELWNSKSVVPIGSAQPSLRLLHEIDSRLRSMKAFSTETPEDEALYLSLDPAATEYNIRTLCLTPEEKRFTYDYNRRMTLFNNSVKCDMTKEEVVCAELTNRYREMMGRKLLAYNNKLTHSAQKHSKWMAGVGQLSHFSTVQGGRTPFERMRNEGYSQGVSENVAFANGPDGSFLGWQHSSGHHRNMLMAGHNEFGIGGVGAYWTQNFGVGGEYKGNEAWHE